MEKTNTHSNITDSRSFTDSRSILLKISRPTIGPSHTERLTNTTGTIKTFIIAAVFGILPVVLIPVKTESRIIPIISSTTAASTIVTPAFVFSFPICISVATERATAVIETEVAI